MNTFTRRRLDGRKPVHSCRSRNAFRTFQIPGIGAVRVAWLVAAGRMIGHLCESRGIRYIVPSQTLYIQNARPCVYSGPRPYKFYFYVETEEII